MVPISGSAYLQGRQWVDMSSWTNQSEDKGEVCVNHGWVELGGWSWVGGVGWGSQKAIYSKLC